MIYKMQKLEIILYHNCHHTNNDFTTDFIWFPATSHQTDLEVNLGPVKGSNGGFGHSSRHGPRQERDEDPFSVEVLLEMTNSSVLVRWS